MSEEQVKEKEEETVEIPEEEEQPNDGGQEEVSFSEESLKEEGWTPEEIDRAKEQGLISKEGKEESKTEESKEEKKEGKQEEKKEEKGQEINLDDLDNFEKVHDLYNNDPKLFYQLPKHIKGLYHNSKGLYKKAKEAEEARKELESKQDFEKVQEAGAKKRLDKIRDRLKDPDNLPTDRELLELIGEEKQAAKDSGEKPLTKADLEEIEKEKEQKQKSEEEQLREQQLKVQQKVVKAEAYANENIKDLTGGKYESIDPVISLAKEMAEKKQRYGVIIDQAFANEDVSEEDVVDIIFDVAKINPKWGEEVEGTSKKKDENIVDRMERNSKKQKTSASISGGKGSRVISHDDLTPEDAAKLNQKQWDALPKKVQSRILRQL